MGLNIDKMKKKILIFTEGTILIHSAGKGLAREKIVQQSKDFGIQMEEKSLSFKSTADYKVVPGAIHDYTSYIPVHNAAAKIQGWKKQGATIYYLSSRRVKSEIEAIRGVLQKYNFPDYQNLFFRQKGEDYQDVAEKFMPDVLVEDDCESIGGESEMTYPNIRDDFKQKIKSIIVKEFGGIDYLPGDINQLLK